MKTFIFFCLLTVGLNGFISSANAQNSRKERKAAREAKLKKCIEEKQFVFVARSVTPMGGRTVNLNFTDELKVYGDSIICDLPYFGQAYNFSTAHSGGLNFTSTNSTYILTEAKNGGWEIRISPKDYIDIREITLFISPDGYTSVTINSSARNSISYYGLVSERKNRKG